MPTTGELVKALYGLSANLGTDDEILSAAARAYPYPQAVKGADPTGATDSSAAFNAAINSLPANSCLFIPAGNYTISSGLNPIPANCTIAGAGEYSTTITTNQASGTFLSFTGANSTITNLAIVNSSGSNTATAVSFSASQLTAINVSITGFGSTTGIFTLTSGATFAGLFNLYIQSSLSSTVGLLVAGADTSISGCVFNGLTIGMLCSANDRFSVVDNIYKTCTTGLSITNTAAAGSTTFGGLQFDGCTTGMSISPGTSQVVQAVTMDACVFDAYTNAVTIAPTSTGTVTYVDFDGCDFISTVNSATAVTINGAANSCQYITFDGCDFVASGTSSVGFTYTAGGVTTAPITFMNCDFNSTTNMSTAAGSANTLPFIVRACPGINPIGKTTTQPAASTGAVTNNLGCDATVYAQIGATLTQHSIGGNAVTAGSAMINLTAPLRVPYGQTVNASQTTGVTWVWVGD